MMKPFPWTGLAGRHIAIDLGTANTVLAARGGEIVVSEPSLVAVDDRTAETLAVGREALDLLGREEISTVPPLAGGVIGDLELTAVLLRHLIGRVQRCRWAPPRVLASAPSGVSDVQRRAVAEACVSAGAREARLVAKPIAAALGSGLPVEHPIGSMVLDIGAGGSEVATISMGAIVASRFVAVGGHEFDQRIITHLKREHRVLIGRQTAEDIKLEIGSASPDGPHSQTEIRGRDITSGRLRAARLTSQEIRGALEQPLTKIIEAITETLAETPPQLACDVMDRGIMLAGGSSRLYGLAERVRLKTGMPAHIADSPHTCVAIGLAKVLENDAARPRSSARRAVLTTAATASN
jgi:rod shape-determining protein MreB